MNNPFDFVPGWVDRLIREGLANYGGGVYVKTPPEMAGLRLVSVGIKDRGLADAVEKVAKENGWFPLKYMRWDNGPSGTITFREENDWLKWNYFYRR